MRLILTITLFFGIVAPLSAAKPNILFISLDDLNDWIGCLGGHPQAKTPNIDRLAASGILFTNAHCPAPACNPSRTAIMSGRSPHRSGLYANGQNMREVLPDATLLPKHFSNHGYWSGGSGKLLHYVIDARSWNEYYPKKESENPFPPHMAWGKRPKALPRGGPWQYVETDWHAFDATDEEFGGDVKVAAWISQQLSRQHEKPFFLACGIYRPHEPWFVPKKYFDLFPLDEVQLPPGYKEDDLADLPPAGKHTGPNRYFAHIRKHKQWKPAVQAYLASIAFADAMVGRVLSALEAGPHKDNTIVVLWSDHGWHLGEKQHWQKFTTWRAATRVPFIVRVPKNVRTLPAGTPIATSNQPVNLLSLYPTLCQLAGLPIPSVCDGPSLLPLLKNPKAPWSHPSVTFGHRPGTFGLSTREWRYLKYANGDEELYHTTKDPYEWTNLAPQAAHANQLAKLRALAPTKFSPFVEASLASLPSLRWNKGAGWPSKPDGNSFPVIFVNQRSKPVELFWLDQKGEPKSYGVIPSGEQKSQMTRPGAVWQIAPSAKEEPLGYFVVGDRKAKAVIPGK